MRALKRLTSYLLAVSVVGGTLASTASGKVKTLVLYEEGKLVPNGTKLDVEDKNPCGEYGQPETWHLLARMKANGTPRIVIGSEPPAEAICSEPGFHPGGEGVELKEIRLTRNGRARAVGVFRFSFEEFSKPPRETCVWEANSATGYIASPAGQAILRLRSVEHQIPESHCEFRTQVSRFQFTLRGSNGTVLEVRPA
jgi:hypothetical protein